MLVTYAKGNRVFSGKHNCVVFRAVLLWLSEHLNGKGSNASKSKKNEEIEYYFSRIIQQGGRFEKVREESETDFLRE
jgi:hypothetical protein